LGSTVGSRFVISVSRTALATLYARSGDLGSALDAFRDSLHDYVRHGNNTHAVTALRSLVGVLAQLHDDEEATLIAGAVSSEQLRVSYGSEAEQFSAVLELVQRRRGPTRSAASFLAGQRLDLDRAVRHAADLVEGHLAILSQSSRKPPAGAAGR
ncbi:MAG: hypothetical protein QOD45_1837, partial [Pseudonocardiales bacterium]|nr:hypothetical protein [Pseudonocardiales bacterium]